jgi:hypothetical protein
MMKLLVFAHRGEAQAFFSEWNLLPVDFFFTGLFRNKDHFVLITGEGPQSSGERTCAVLSAFHSEIESVTNLGIAGSLTPKLTVGSHVWVRSIYAQHAEKCEFKSFTTKKHDNFDCISAFSRITLLEDRQKLASFADIVDRELWAIASTCHMLRVDLSALKLISDDLQSENMCQLIKEEAPKLSKKLFDLYNESLKQKKLEVPTSSKTHNMTDMVLAHPKFYFTTSQTRKLTQTLRGLSLKKLLSSEEELMALVNGILENYGADKTSKELSKILLNSLGEKLNPLNTEIREKIAVALRPFTESGIQASFDPELEQDFVQINYQMKNARDQKRLMLSLEQFNFQKIKDIFSGKLES